MDLLPIDSPPISSRTTRSFGSLELINVNDDDILTQTPFGAVYGRLDNGFTYYVRCNSMPKMRAAVSLALKVGSVLEEEEERGVAHIIEHLAFSATKTYTNHDIIKFLESIGAEFGACQNAVTTVDETIYDLFVPVDKPELLSQAISVLAEFSSEVSTVTFKRDDLKGLPITFPSSVIRDIVWSPMVEAQCAVQLCFPLLIKNENMMEDVNLTSHMSRLLEAKLLQVLRFKHGQIYSAGVSVYLGGNRPSGDEVQGDISVNFSCDPKISSALADIALDEILRLQEEGPSDDDISAILEIDQRAHENGLQDNYCLLDKLRRSYKSRVYSGDIAAAFEIQDDVRTRVRNYLTPSTVKETLRRILPYPCKSQYTVVILMPKPSHFKMKSYFGSKILVGVSALAVAVLSLWRYSRRVTK